MISRYARALIIGVIIFFIDRFTKSLAYQTLQVTDFFICKGVSFSLTYNTGIAWSLFSDAGWIVEGIIAMMTLYFLYQISKYARERMQHGQSIMGELLIIAGGLSNLCDRWLYSGVIDFIKIEGYGYTFPIFNIADVSVCFGIMIILYHLFYTEISKKEKM